MGFIVVDDTEQILLELSFAEISYARYQKHDNPQSQLHNFYLGTVHKDGEYIFQSPEAESLNALMLYLIDGLKKRSLYVVAMQDYKHPTQGVSFLNLKRGDLIALKNGMTGAEVMSSTWGYGECNGKTGDFPTENVYILPTTHVPPAGVLAAYKKEGAFIRRIL